MNNGIIIEKRETDYVSGENSPIVFRAVSNNWTDHIDFFEKQKLGFETDACVLFTAQESFDAQINNQIENGQLPQLLVGQLTQMGFMDMSVDGSPRFHSSPRFLHVLAGTRFNGTAMPLAWDTMRKYGVLPWTDLPFDETTTVDDYFKPITAAQLLKAGQFLSLIGGKNAIQYHWLVNGGANNIVKMKNALPQAPLCLGTPVCPPWNQEQPPTCTLQQPSHSTMAYKIDNVVHILDHYAPFEKNLGFDYPIPYVLQGIVSVTYTVPQVPVDVAPTVQNVTLLQQILSLWQKIAALLSKGRTTQ